MFYGGLLDWFIPPPSPMHGPSATWYAPNCSDYGWCFRVLGLGSFYHFTVQKVSTCIFYIKTKKHMPQSTLMSSGGKKSEGDIELNNKNETPR
jgi:hypothetical protein